MQQDMDKQFFVHRWWYNTFRRLSTSSAPSNIRTRGTPSYISFSSAAGKVNMVAKMGELFASTDWWTRNTVRIPVEWEAIRTTLPSIKYRESCFWGSQSLVHVLMTRQSKNRRVALLFCLWPDNSVTWDVKRTHHVSLAYENLTNEITKFLD